MVLIYLKIYGVIELQPVKSLNRNTTFLMLRHLGRKAGISPAWSLCYVPTHRFTKSLTSIRFNLNWVKAPERHWESESLILFKVKPRHFWIQRINDYKSRLSSKIQQGWKIDRYILFPNFPFPKGCFILFDGNGILNCYLTSYCQWVKIWWNKNRVYISLYKNWCFEKNWGILNNPISHEEKNTSHYST